MTRTPKRPPKPLSIEQLHHRAESQNLSCDGGKDAASSQHDALVREFESVLEEDVHLDAHERQTIVSQYADALNKTPVELGAPDIDTLKRNFSLAMEAMLAENGVSPAERESLERQMDEAVRAVQSPEVLRAAEYARRVEEHGPEEAAAWLSSTATAPMTEQGDRDPDFQKERSGTTPTTLRRRRRV